RRGRGRGRARGPRRLGERRGVRRARRGARRGPRRGLRAAAGSARRAGRRAWLWLALGLALGGLLATQGLTLMRVTGGSMAPAYPDGALVLVVRPPLHALAFPGRGYVRGDVVVVAPPGGGLSLKRIAAVGPATVAMAGGTLYVDGEAVPAPQPGREGVARAAAGPRGRVRRAGHRAGTRRAVAARRRQAAAGLARLARLRPPAHGGGAGARGGRLASLSLQAAARRPSSPSASAFAFIASRTNPTCSHRSTPSSSAPRLTSSRFTPRANALSLNFRFTLSSSRFLMSLSGRTSTAAVISPVISSQA